LKKTSFLFTVLVIGFFLFTVNLLYADVDVVKWNTFQGCVDKDFGEKIVLDNSGNIYIIGTSHGSWGTPINAYTDNGDAFVAKFDNNGNLIWNTYLGSGGYQGASGQDIGCNIALDSSSNIYVVGYSNYTWGSPINPISSNFDIDVFVACLDNNGNRIWNTFLGSSAGSDYGRGIVLDNSGNIFISGTSGATWGIPIHVHLGNGDAFIASLDNSGNLLWNTFMGSSSSDYGFDITRDSSGNLYVVGQSPETWGSPVNAHSGGEEVFICCIESLGFREWNTFLGSSSTDWGYSIAVDDSDNIYITGGAQATWGTPINAFSGGEDAFLAKLDNLGNFQWNTFLGSASTDRGESITLDNLGNIFVTGESWGSWGSPLNAHSGGWDIFITCLDNNGNIFSNTFFGSNQWDFGNGITLDSSRNIYITGNSNADWGNPINAYSGDYDIILAKLCFPPLLDIIANGSDGPISITGSEILKIRISLNTNGLSDNVDFWLVYKGPSGWYYFDNSIKQWRPGLNVAHQGVLFNVKNNKVFQSSGLALGNYTFYFGVDMVMDGKVTKSSLYKDEVKVTVTQ
jgi:hypothetical protein